jgi:hypothetical protein
MSSSERVPGRRRCEFEIADIRAEPYPHPRADRDHDDVVHRQRRHSQAADQVSRTLDAGEALVCEMMQPSHPIHMLEAGSACLNVRCARLEFQSDKSERTSVGQLLNEYTA